MGTSDNGQEVLRQNLEEKGTFQALYQMHLLFREKGKRPEGKKILGRLQKEFGQVDLVADVDHSLATFAIADFPVEYKKGYSGSGIDGRFYSFRSGFCRPDATFPVVGLSGWRKIAGQL